MGERARQKCLMNTCGTADTVPSYGRMETTIELIPIVLPFFTIFYFCFPLCMDSSKKRQKKRGMFSICAAAEASTRGMFKCGRHDRVVGEMTELSLACAVLPP